GGAGVRLRAGAVKRSEGPREAWWRGRDAEGSREAVAPPTALHAVPLPATRGGMTQRLIAAALSISPQGIRMRHSDDVVAGIDEVNFAGHTGRKVGEKIKTSAAEIVERDTAMQRRVTLLERKH